MGFGGGVVRRGQVHGELIVLSGVCISLSEQGCAVASQAVSGSIELHVCRVSPTIGKFLVMIPSAVQVSLLRKSLSESLVTYTIWRLSRALPEGDLPENLRMTAPRMLIPWLFTACIFMVTGIRSLSHRPRRRMTVMLAKQLWQPVSAIAERCTGVNRDLGGLYPRAV